ncbi:hypothetical protein [Brevibacterium otitidis]|uniref:RCK C-terminal domain-containing protein n=1 Tax=Brevibacterium otitidis TaxID=53364 RepID=A0ABV5X056_9MICO|nr:hypothetical protein GCM10023233_29160 [Brevibacterium otitidis]
MNDTHVPWRSKARTFFTGGPTPMAEHGAGWANTDGGTVLEADDEIIIAGAPDAVERFSALDENV